jgi:DNA topoisomerase I
LLVDSPDSVQAVIDPRDAAESAGLRYISDDRPGIRRKKAGTGVTFTRPDRSRIAERARHSSGLDRCLDLPVRRWPYSGDRPRCQGPQAISLSFPLPRGKYEHVVAFADALPAIREKVREHMSLRGLPREKVLGTVVHLLETTLIRVGNDDHARQNNSYGLTTLKNRHVAVDGNEVRFRFTGKSGKQWSLRVRDRRVAKIIRACQELPGQELIQYLDEQAFAATSRRPT